MAVAEATSSPDSNYSFVTWTSGAPAATTGQRWEITYSGGTVTVEIALMQVDAEAGTTTWFVRPRNLAWVSQTVTAVLLGASMILGADVGTVSLAGQPVAVVDPHWESVSFLIGYDLDVVDEGPRQITITDVGTPTRTVPAVGQAAGAYNQAGGVDLRNWVPADRILSGLSPEKYYWEFEANAGGPAQFNGYHGVVSQQQLDDPNQTYDSGVNPIAFGSLSYRGTGDTWGNGLVSVAGPAPYGAGDVVMIAFEPSSGRFWVGLNGTWRDDPATGAPTRTSDDAGGDFWPVLQAREPGEGGTLRSVTSQFSYLVPSGCVALGATSEAGPSLEGTYSPSLINGGAETGDLTGWTGDVAVVASAIGATPHTGAYFFFGGAGTAASSMYQDVAIDPNDISLVDAGLMSATLSWWQASWAGHDGTEFSLSFFDSFGTWIGGIKHEFVAPISWTQFSIDVPVPINTRRVRVQSDMTNVSGSDLYAYVDDIEIVYKDVRRSIVDFVGSNVVMGAVPNQVSVNGIRNHVILGATTDLTVKRTSTFIIVET